MIIAVLALPYHKRDGEFINITNDLGQEWGNMDYKQLEETMRRLSLAAGDVIMDIYGRDDFDVKSKSDDSPVTAADEAADALISAGLRAAFPDVMLVTEEQSESHSANG